MKNILLVVAFILAHTITSFAQKSDNFIELKTGEIIPVVDEKIKEREPIFKSNFLKVGDTKYSIKDVKGYQYRGTYLGNHDNSMFIPRVVTGKINVYQYIEVRMSGNGKSHQILHRYLQKGDNTKWVKFSSSALKGMLRGNKEALSMFNQYTKQLSQKRIFYWSGVGGLIVGIGLFVASMSGDQSGLKKGPLVAGGVVTAGSLATIVVGAVHGVKGELKLLKAIDIYNSK